jgi:hypothetical protein
MSKAFLGSKLMSVWRPLMKTVLRWYTKGFPNLARANARAPANAPDAVLGNSEPDTGSLGHGEDLEPVDDGQPRAQPELCVVQVASATSGATCDFPCPVCLAGDAQVRKAISSTA